ncbi:MAG: Calx-beta domain-containing protein [Aphanizomenon gracile PMC649.10]|nr:Calx-beta domain-containing protein [Aphanizomenon gracile PMC649.10]
MSLMNNDSAVKLISGQLGAFANQDNFWSLFDVAFGKDYNQAVALRLKSQWQAGDFSSFPKIEIRPAADINRANGAFALATNTIYLSQEFITNHQGDVGAIATVLLEEYGHWVDSKINTTDTLGDEGQIFASMVQVLELTPQALAILQAEDDTTVITIDGREITIEQADTPIVTFSVAPQIVSEDGDTNLAYIFTRTGDLTNSLSVGILVSGTAIFGSDFTQNGATIVDNSTVIVTFAPGASEATVSVYPIKDSINEEDETISVSLALSINYIVGTPDAIIGTITNGARLTLPSISVSPKGGDIVGEGGTQVFEIKLSNPYDQPIEVLHRVKNWTAKTENYYTDFDSFTGLTSLTFDPGELVKEVYISTKDDLIDENEEKYIFEVYKASAGEYSLIPEPIQVVGRIEDNDYSPSSLNITSLSHPSGSVFRVDSSSYYDPTWIDIDFSYDNQSNGLVWIFSGGTGSTTVLGSFTYDIDNDYQTNGGLLPKSGYSGQEYVVGRVLQGDGTYSLYTDFINQQSISRDRPGEITAVSLFMQQQLANSTYGNILKEVTLPVDYIFVDDIDFGVTKLPVMDSVAQAGKEFTYAISIIHSSTYAIDYRGKVFLTEILPKGVTFVRSDIGPVFLEKDGDKTRLTFIPESLAGTITVIPTEESRPIDDELNEPGWLIKTETHVRSGERYMVLA